MSTAARRQLLVFALDELSRRNGHYDFELLCQEVVRARIASNLITNTGPVSARGDQSRDAETYFSYLPAELGHTGTFLASVSDGAAAFCCTLQRRGLRSKFLADVQGVVATGPPVSRVYLFCSERVAVGTRHEWEAEIYESLERPVVILDGRWLSEQLAAPELYWVAERYLDVPEEAAPPSERMPELPNWYLDTRSRWRTRHEPPRTHGDFNDLRGALRLAVMPGEARPDLPFWLARVTQLVDAEPQLRLRAQYEVARACVIGQQNLTPVDALVRDYFAALGDDPQVFRLSEARTLLLYVSAMTATGKQ